MQNRAGVQYAVQESFCVHVPPHEGHEHAITRCVDTVDRLPAFLSVVRPRGVVTIRFRGTTAVRDGRIRVRVLGKKRYIYSLAMTEPRKRWRVKLRPRAYEVEVSGRFTMADGRTGDTHVTLGLLVDRKRKLAIVRGPEPIATPPCGYATCPAPAR